MGFMTKSGCIIADSKPQVTTTDQLCDMGWGGGSVSTLELLKIRLKKPFRQHAIPIIKLHLHHLQVGAHFNALQPKTPHVVFVSYVMSVYAPLISPQF